MGMKDIVPNKLPIYASLGFLMTGSSYYIAYHLNEPMFIRGGGTPSINFFPMQITSFVGTGLFPLAGIVFALIPAASAFLFVRFTMNLSFPRSTIFMAIGLALSSLLTYSFIPVAISSGATLTLLAAVVAMVMVFRSLSVNPGLPPDREGSFSDKVYERARERWMWLLRQSMWLAITILVAQALQAILAFQLNLVPTIPPPEQSPYHLDFFRYQILITLFLFIYLVLGVLSFATLFCYDRVVKLELMQLRQEEQRQSEDTDS